MKLSTLKKTYSLYFNDVSSLHKYESILSSQSNAERMVNNTKFHSLLLSLDMHMNDFLNLHC